MKIAPLNIADLKNTAGLMRIQAQAIVDETTTPEAARAVVCELAGYHGTVDSWRINIVRDDPSEQIPAFLADARDQSEAHGRDAAAEAARVLDACAGHLTDDAPVPLAKAALMACADHIDVQVQALRDFAKPPVPAAEAVDPEDDAG